MYKVAFIFLAVLLTHSNVMAQERSAVSSQSSTYINLIQTIEDLEALKDMIEASITQIKTCGDSNQIFDGTAGCKPAITENDPQVLDHSRSASGNITNNCGGQNQSQYYNGTSWECKTLGP